MSPQERREHEYQDAAIEAEAARQEAAELLRQKNQIIILLERAEAKLRRKLAEFEALERERRQDMAMAAASKVVSGPPVLAQAEPVGDGSGEF